MNGFGGLLQVLSSSEKARLMHSCIEDNARCDYEESSKMQKFHIGDTEYSLMQVFNKDEIMFYAIEVIDMGKDDALRRFSKFIKSEDIEKFKERLKNPISEVEFLELFFITI